MENNNNEGKVLLSGFNNVVEFKIPDWNQDAIKNMKKTPLYKNAAKPSNLLKSTNKIMLDQSISTNGWDTVSICRVSALNAQIKVAKTYPESMDITEPGSTISVNGEFDAWQVVTGGDGKNVKINVPFKNGVYRGIQFNGQDTFDLAGSSVDILVKLQYFPLPEPSIADGEYNLYINTEGATPTEPIAAVINLHVENEYMDDINKSILKGEVEKWLNIPENLKKFDTLFSTININNMGEGSEQFSWLRATSISYAYTDIGTEDTSTFGILCMTNHRSCAGLPNQLPAVSLKEDNNALFVISREIFVRYQLFPSLPYIFPGSSQADYTIDKTGLTINAKKLKLDDVKVGAIYYHPVADDFEITFDETYIRTTTKVSCEISPGIVSHTVIVTKQTLIMDVNSNGEKIMSYEMVGDPEISNSVETSPGIIVTEVILGLIGAVVTAIAACVAGPIVALVIGIIAALVVAIVSITIHVIIEKVIAEGIQDAVPSIEPMVKIASSQIKWPFCCEGGLDLTNIDYLGALIFEGNLAIDESFQLKEGRLISA